MANLAGQGVPFILLIVVTPTLLRSLGREQYGALVLFNLIPQIAGQLDLGLSTAATRGFAQYCAHADRAGAMRLFREVLMLLTGWGVLLATAFQLLHETIAHALKLDGAITGDSLAYVAAAISIPLALANGATLVPLRALERYGRAAQVQVIAGLVYWSVCAAWAANGATLPQLVALGTLSVALTTVALYLIVDAIPPVAVSTTIAVAVATGDDGHDAVGAARVADVVRPPAPVRLLLRPFLSVGVGAFVAQISSLATFNADKLLVSALVSPAAAGAYTICTSLANKTLLVIASAATFTFPRATHLHASGDHRGLIDIYRTTARVCTALAFAALVPILGFADVFLALWLGRSFADDYAIVLRLLAIGYTLAAASVVAANVTMGIGNAHIAAAFALLGGLLTIAGLLALTPTFGIAGAAAASLIGMSQTVVFNAMISRRLGPEAVRTSWPLLLQLAVVAAPISIGLAWLATILHGWATFIPALLLAVPLFPVVWLLSFGRHEEWPVLKRLFLSFRKDPVIVTANRDADEAR